MPWERSEALCCIPWWSTEESNSGPKTSQASHSAAAQIHSSGTLDSSKSLSTSASEHTTAGETETSGLSNSGMFPACDN